MKTESSKLQTFEIVGRESDIAYILDCVKQSECCSIVGASNVGKSTLLRALTQPTLLNKYMGSHTEHYMLVYVDLNLTLQVTEQGFCEVILRSTRELLASRASESSLQVAIDQAYQQVIQASNPLMISLAFENSLDAISGNEQRVLVLLFDEFDGIFAQIDPQVFVRLRALKDKHNARICYVTATDHPLEEIRDERQTGEFCELFEAHTRHLTPLREEDARTLIVRWAAQNHVEFNVQDISFVWERAGGHPGLLQATCRVLAKAREEQALVRQEIDGYEHVLEGLHSDANVRLECAKLWSDLARDDQEVLIALLGGHVASSPLDALLEKGILRSTPTGEQVFAGQFGDFVQRQRLVRRTGPRGVRIDVAAGDVWVDGKPAPVLTELEYKLLLLLYGNLDKLCDKYKIVESVWGENYIDEVDDARIEKLMSRLRDKIEPKPDDPKYLLTVRGRGYKLISPE